MHFAPNSFHPGHPCHLPVPPDREGAWQREQTSVRTALRPFIDDFPIKTSIYGDFPWLCQITPDGRDFFKVSFH